MNKLLFLDVDGVLNNAGIIRQHGHLGLGCKQLSLLKVITAATCCEIVLASTWRLLDEHRDALKAAFEEHLIPHWIDVTPDLGYVKRCDEILSWLVGYDQPSRVVILDDDADAALVKYPPRVQELLFVKTDFNDGLTLDHAEAVLEFMKEDCK